mmetsp:Transcript_68483/g.222915  ORF Transcript_68483/g.222915 Transcript_68483/m.222915 type:complete len:130 (-) Transcript_68483:41-430(-)
MEGFEGSDIHPELAPLEADTVVWRDRVRPSGELLEVLKAKAITKVVLAGTKTGQGILATTEALSDEGLLVYIVRECVADSSVERHEVVLDQVLNQYADVLGVEAFREQISQEIMLDMYVAFKTVNPPAG